MLRADAAEQALVGGRPLTESVITDAAESAGQGIAPAADVHGPAEYRLHLVRVLTRRALTETKARLEERRD